MSDRLCAWCAKPLVRRKDESRGEWDVRKFCCRTCVAKGRRWPLPSVDKLPPPAELRALGLSQAALSRLFGVCEHTIRKALSVEARPAPHVFDRPVIVLKDTRFPELGRYAFQDVTAADCALLRSLPWPVVERDPPTYACLTVATKRYREGHPRHDGARV